MNEFLAQYGQQLGVAILSAVGVGGVGYGGYRGYRRWTQPTTRSVREQVIDTVHRLHSLGVSVKPEYVKDWMQQLDDQIIYEELTNVTPKVR